MSGRDGHAWRRDMDTLLQENMKLGGTLEETAAALERARAAWDRGCGWQRAADVALVQGCEADIAAEAAQHLTQLQELTAGHVSGALLCSVLSTAHALRNRIRCVMHKAIEGVSAAGPKAR
jgi:hypothetical protein